MACRPWHCWVALAWAAGLTACMTAAHDVVVIGGDIHGGSGSGAPPSLDPNCTCVHGFCLTIPGEPHVCLCSPGYSGATCADRDSPNAVPWPLLAGVCGAVVIAIGVITLGCHRCRRNRRQKEEEAKLAVCMGAPGGEYTLLGAGHSVMSPSPASVTTRTLSGESAASWRRRSMVGAAAAAATAPASPVPVDVCQQLAASRPAVGRLLQSVPFEEVYVLGEQLGVGATSTVHRCSHTLTRETRAVKVINKAALAQQARASRHCSAAQVWAQLEEEVGVCAALRHPLVVTTLALFESNTMVHIVMEFVAGGTLLDRVTALQRPLTEQEACVVLRQVCSALAHMHAAGVCHRDVKLDNVFLTSPEPQSWALKVGDFGVSCLLTAAAADNDYVGSVPYMSPEVVEPLPDTGDAATASPRRHSRGAGPPSLCATRSPARDCWAVGVLAYTLFTLRLPFSCGDEPGMGGVDDSDAVSEGYPEDHFGLVPPPGSPRRTPSRHDHDRRGGDDATDSVNDDDVLASRLAGDFTEELTKMRIRWGQSLLPVSSLPVSPTARAFVGRLMAHNPGVRMTMEQALRHAFLATPQHSDGGGV